MELIKVMFLATVQEIDQLFQRDTDDQSALFYRTETT